MNIFRKTGGLMMHFCVFPWTHHMWATPWVPLLPYYTNNVLFSLSSHALILIEANYFFLLVEECIRSYEFPS